MEYTIPLSRFVIAGRLTQDFRITHKKKIILNTLGGGVLYAAVGASIWESNIALISRVGPSFPKEWLDRLAQKRFDTRGIRIISQEIDHRYFSAYNEADVVSTENPVQYFSRIGEPFPKELLGYTPASGQINSRNQPTPGSIRLNDIPSDYLDATAAHICPIDFVSHSLLTSALRQGHITTLTLDPAAGYMVPAFWDDLPVVFHGVTALLCSIEKIKNLYQGRSSDIWEMAEGLAEMGCDIVVIKRGMQGQMIYNHASHAKLIIPAYPARVEDLHGAGDAFCGGFLTGYRNSYDPLQACLHGNISASIVVEGSDPFYGLDTMPGLAWARLDALKDMVRKV
jgi:sugar/nucleoside kinase (ribokinase family)